VPPASGDQLAEHRLDPALMVRSRVVEDAGELAELVGRRPPEVRVPHALVVTDEHLDGARDVARLRLRSRIDRLLAEQLDDGEHDALLGVEVVEHGLVGHARPSGDAGERDVVVRLDEEHLHRSVSDPVPRRRHPIGPGGHRVWPCCFHWSGTQAQS
jgi:hypothetical protein